MLKIFQARLQQYVKCELPDVQAGLEKAEESEIKLPTLLDHIKSKGIQNKISTSASLTTLKPLTVCMHTCSVPLVIYLRPYGL